MYFKDQEDFLIIRREGCERIFYVLNYIMSNHKEDRAKLTSKWWQAAVTIWAVELVGKFQLCMKEENSSYHTGGETLEIGLRDIVLSLSLEMLKTCLDKSLSSVP